MPLEFVTVPDDVTRLAMLETGELDLVYEVAPHQFKRLKRNKDVKIKVSDQVPSLFGLNMIYAMRSNMDYTWVPNEGSPLHLQRIQVVK
jgi:ABC-type transport system substrate-binding protein